MHTIKEVIEYWNTNHYTQAICVYSLKEIFRLQYKLEYNEWHNLEIVLDGIIDETTINDTVVINAINTIENIITDKNELKEIACILSGDYLQPNEKELVELLKYYHWSIPRMKNIFIGWYYRLVNLPNYYEYAITYFKKSKILSISYALGILATGMTIPYLFIIILMFMTRQYFTEINSIILVGLLLVSLLGTITVASVLLHKFDFVSLLKRTIGFKEYKL